MNRFIFFDAHSGLLRCEAGISLKEILEIIVPRHWFLPVTPGTKFVTLGGAIANDVHGKNHHSSGTFGRFVTQFELLRSDGKIYLCSPTQNVDLFRATIGGLGLTGLILWAEIRLIPIKSPFLDIEVIAFDSLDLFSELTSESDRKFDYTVSWIDSLVSGSPLGRGIFMRGNFSSDQSDAKRSKVVGKGVVVPFDFPSFFLNSFTIKIFNAIYFSKNKFASRKKKVFYDGFFYPLDCVHSWNRLYGKKGFFQYQCVVPKDKDWKVIQCLLGQISRSKMGSFLSVLKVFSSLSSPGLMSFPREGLTLALDLPNRGESTLKLMEELDNLVRKSGGAVYPAKDARMSKESFQTFYPQWKEFQDFVDPSFSSSFWRRVT